MKAFSMAILAFSLVWAPASDAQDRKAPVLELKGGGYLILIRHGETDMSLLPREQRKPEPSPMDLTNCEMQAKLTAQGHEDARMIGAAFQSLGIPVAQVLASGYCRTMETARLAFGRAEASDMLLHPAYTSWPGIVPAPAPYAQRAETLKRFLAAPPPQGSNIVFVTHGEILRGLFGFMGATGESLILKPDGQGGFNLVARVLPNAWLATP